MVDVSDVVIASNAFVRIGLHGIRGRRWRGDGLARLPAGCA